MTASNGSPKAYRYRRCSHANSQDSGLGLEEQIERVDRYLALVQLDYPELQAGDWCIDEAVSASKYRLLQRKGGRKLNGLLRPGDHVIFAEMDRGFRDPEDFLAMKRIWDQRKITIHFADLKVDLGSADGMFVASLIAVVAGWYARKASERNTASAARMKAQGRPAGGPAPYGFKWAGRKRHRHLIPAPEQRRIGREIVRLRDQRQWTWQEIGRHVEATLAQGQRWGIHRYQLAYDAERKLQGQQAEAERGSHPQRTDPPTA